MKGFFPQTPASPEMSHSPVENVENVLAIENAVVEVPKPKKAIVRSKKVVAPVVPVVEEALDDAPVADAPTEICAIVDEGADYKKMYEELLEKYNALVKSRPVKEKGDGSRPLEYNGTSHKVQEMFVMLKAKRKFDVGFKCFGMPTQQKGAKVKKADDVYEVIKVDKEGNPKAVKNGSGVFAVRNGTFDKVDAEGNPQHIYLMVSVD